MAMITNTSELEPTADRRFDAELKPKKAVVAVKPGKTKPGDTRTPKPGETKKDPVAPPVEPGPGPKPVGSMGLKNPFETRAPGG